MRSALILGGARCLHDDLRAAEALGFRPDLIVGTNEAGRDREGELHAWASMHVDKLYGWVRERAEAGRPPAAEHWTATHRTSSPAKKGLKPLNFRGIPSWGGSTGLLAVTGCITVWQADRILLVGVPMEVEQAHYFDKRPWAEANRYRGAWNRYLPQLRNRVKSMSGWTRQLLGSPDEGWIGAERGTAEAGGPHRTPGAACP